MVNSYFKTIAYLKFNLTKNIYLKISNFRLYCVIFKILIL